LVLIGAASNDPIQGWPDNPPRDVVVAVIDSGLQVGHPEFAGQIWVNAGEVPGNGVDDDGNGYVDDVSGWDFVDGDNDVDDSCYDHGTRTSSILGARRNNGIGLSGMAEHVRIMPLRVLDCRGTSDEGKLVEAIEYANANGAQLIQAVVFISGAWDVSCWDTPSCVPALCSAIDASDLLVVTVAGNEGIDLDQNPRWPVWCRSTQQLTVTAHDAEGLISESYGSIIDLAARGTNVWILRADGSYERQDGASYAAPQVAALAAWLLWLDPRMDVAALKTRILAHRDAQGNLIAFAGAVPEPSTAIALFTGVLCLAAVGARTSGGPARSSPRDDRENHCD
jgi:subtilisin family serine protease